MKTDDGWIALSLVILACVVSVALLYWGGPDSAWAMVAGVIGAVAGWIGRSRAGGSDG